MSLIDTSAPLAPEGDGPPAQTVLGLQFVHLISGLELIGKVFAEPSAGGFWIEQPRIIQMIPDEKSGRVTVALLPLRPWIDGDQKVFIRDGHFVLIMPVVDQLAHRYIQETSGLTIANVIPPQQ